MSLGLSKIVETEIVGSGVKLGSAEQLVGLEQPRKVKHH